MLYSTLNVPLPWKPHTYQSYGRSFPMIICRIICGHAEYFRLALSLGPRLLTYRPNSKQISGFMRRFWCFLVLYQCGTHLLLISSSLQSCRAWLEGPLQLRAMTAVLWYLSCYREVGSLARSQPPPSSLGDTAGGLGGGGGPCSNSIPYFTSRTAYSHWIHASNVPSSNQHRVFLEELMSFPWRQLERADSSTDRQSACNISVLRCPYACGNRSRFLWSGVLLFFFFFKAC